MTPFCRLQQPTCRKIRYNSHNMANLSETDIIHAFEYFDKDNSKSISHTELGDALRLAGMNPTDTEIAEMIKEADKDGSGKIEFPEFVKLLKELEKIDCRDELRAAFNHFDINGDGRISADELQKQLGYTIDDAKEIVREADLDADGYIDFEEFVTLLTKPQNVFD